MEQTMTKTKNETKEKKRDIGLDALRIISMIMILFLHYLGKGGLLEWANNSQFYNVLYYGIEAACIVAVNCYVLISGYFLLHAKFRWKKLFKLWGEVFFYSVAIYLMIVGVGLKEFEMKEMIKCLFPILTKQYWFVSVYFMLYALSPFLNKLIFALNQKEHKTLLAILILGFSVVSFLPSGYTLDGTGGYSIIWFVCLYLIATYLRQYGIPKWIHIKRWGWVYLGCTMIIAGGMILIEYVCQKTGRNSFAPKLLQYNNLFVLIESIALFL